jgi:hypothetical protein
MKTLGELGLDAEDNLLKLRNNIYPGRGIIGGVHESGDAIIHADWLMGRSKGSRNRAYAEQGGRVYTTAANPFDVSDSSLLYYNAMRERHLTYFRGNSEFCDLPGIPGYGSATFHILSNGDQTDTVHTHYSKSPGPLRDAFRSALQQSTYEPDDACTPRITAVSAWIEGTPRIEFSILRKSVWSDACERDFYDRSDVGAGFGYCLTTYQGDGNPPPSYRGEPFLLPLRGDIEQVAVSLWHSLNPENRVAVAVKFIPKKGTAVVRIINRF